ncbi:MAG: GNAT family N-acetyltransferase [Bdellovibrionota bacterium]
MDDVVRRASERLATMNDLPALLELEQRAFPQSRWASEATLTLRLELPDAVTWLSFDDGAPAGFANGFPIKDLATQSDLDPPDQELYLPGGQVWLLRNIAVRPSLQRRGIGRRLVEKQVEAARSYGARCARFTAPDSLAEFYTKLGFRIIRKAGAFHGLPQAVWESSLRD